MVLVLQDEAGPQGLGDVFVGWLLRAASQDVKGFARKKGGVKLHPGDAPRVEARASKLVVRQLGDSNALDLFLVDAGPLAEIEQAVGCIRCRAGRSSFGQADYDPPVGQLNRVVRKRLSGSAVRVAGHCHPVRRDLSRTPFVAVGEHHRDCFVVALDLAAFLWRNLLQVKPLQMFLVEACLLDCDVV